MFELIEAVTKELDAKAKETGEAQSQTISSNGWQPVIHDGKKIGRVRFSSIEITVTPANKASSRRKVRAGKKPAVSKKSKKSQPA